MSKKGNPTSSVDGEVQTQKDNNKGSKLTGHKAEESESVGSEESQYSKPLDSDENKSSNKRKREVNEESLEVNLSLPEPPSKKAQRKAKKLKAKGSKSADIVTTAETNMKDEETQNTVVNPKQVVGVDGHLEGKPDEPMAKSKDSKKTMYSIWVGNLPFAATKSMLIDFFTTNSEPRILKEAITRVHMPAPTNATKSPNQMKPMNKGFAYVDFAEQESFIAALALSEASLGSRKLLIKDAKNFEGRPQEHEKHEKPSVSKTSNRSTSQRIFVGNLGFDVTKDELSSFFEVCGTIEHIHMATFQDSGKCKGYAWITFGDTQAAKHAVRGWTHVSMPEDEDTEADEAETSVQPGKPKKRQVFCNKLHGREIRREFAEDATTRYNKRFGRRRPDYDVDQPAIEEVPNSRSSTKAQTQQKPGKKQPAEIKPGAQTDPQKRRGRTHSSVGGKGEQAQEIKERIQYQRGQITEATGTRIMFD